MEPCRRPDCGRGVIDEQGFCGACDRPPPPVGPPPAGTASAGRPASAQRGASAPLATVRPDPWYGLGLVETGRLPDGPADRVPHPASAPHSTTGPVAEEHRFCGNPACEEPVGRGHDGEPGRTSGYCPRCGTPFDFEHPQGHTIAGRYDLQRRLGFGAYGEAYLAHDRNLDTRVVLKALKATSVARMAERERDTLVALRHDGIVRILGYEPKGPHLVLEYVPGVPLSPRSDDRLEILLAHGVRILQALDYLHAKGLLHCDVKPLNIIRFREDSSAGSRDQVRLIDFGSVRTQKDTSPVVAFTSGYAPPEGDPERLRPTAGFDLFGLAVTLAEVCRSHLQDRAAPGVDSLRLLLERGTDVRVPQRRFVSARQFGEQLSGVIRQVVAAAPARRQVVRASALFGSMTQPLDGGLGTVRPLDHWVGANVTEDGFLALPEPFAAPEPEAVAAALPAPLSDADYPDVTGIAGPAEGPLATGRSALRSGDAALAERAFQLAGLPRWHWLHPWYAGLVALAARDTERATDEFTAVRAALPGELIPQLALGLCAELRGDLTVAQAHYATVVDTAPALGAAGFGLARVHLLAGRRADAVATAGRLALEPRFEREAKVAAVRLRVAVMPAPPGGTPHDVPEPAGLAQAREALAELDLDDTAAHALRAEIQYAEFLRTHDRLRLSEAVRGLRGLAGTKPEHTALVDLANRLRPPVRWRRAGRNREGLKRREERKGLDGDAGSDRTANPVSGGHTGR